MRISLECGLIEAGVAACISSFCLAPFSAASQTPAEPPALTNESAEITAVERVQQQQLALIDAVERIRENSDIALQRYTDAVLTQFTLVQEHFAAQEARNTAAAERLNNLIQTVIAVMIGGAALSVLVIAWVPLWATNRMTRRIIELRRARRMLSPQPAEPGIAGTLEIESALNRLEQRLLSLETGSSHAAVPCPAEQPVSEPPMASKSPLAPRVALAVDEGSALMFLPHEVQATRWAGFRRQFTHLKKLWARSRPASP